MIGLLGESMESCVLMDKRTVSDGMGGVETTYQDGAEFDAAISKDNSMQARIAQKSGVTALYTITTQRSVNLQFRDVIRRKSDGKVFRITSDGDDSKTPESAGLDMRVVSAEEWTIA